MNTTIWIVAVERYGASGGGGGLDIPAPIGEQALTLASEVARRAPAARIVLSCSLPDNAVYQGMLAQLPALVLQTEATQAALQNALPALHGEGTLLIYWVGHGVMASDERLLLCADSSNIKALRGIDVDSLLVHLRSKEFPRTQLGFFDACAQVVPQPASVLKLGNPVPVPTDQYFYFSAAAAQVAAASAGPRSFSGAVLSALADPARPFPPEPAPLFADLGRRFEELQLSTRAFPLQRTNGSGDMWDYVGAQADNALDSFARAAHCSPREFEHLRSAAAGCVDDQALCDALRDRKMDRLLDEVDRTAGETQRVRALILRDAWQRLRFARELEAACLRIGLSWAEWQDLREQVVSLDNLGGSVAPDSLSNLLAGLLDQANPERGSDSCIRLLALAARRARRNKPALANQFEAEVRGARPLAERWSAAVNVLPKPDGPVFLLIGLQIEPHGGVLSVGDTWLYQDNEVDHSWEAKPILGTVVEQLNELIQIAKVRYGPLIVELLAPSELLCSPRELFELVNSDLGTSTWLEAQSVLVLRWHDRMKGATRFAPGDWVEQAQARVASMAGTADLDIGWLNELPPGHIVGLPFPGPTPAFPKRNRVAFFDALLKGDPWMCWPRVEHADLDAFKQRVRDFIRDHGGARAGQPHALAEALRQERRRGQDPILCSLWLFIDDPKRNPYELAFTEMNQRTTP